MAHSTIKLLPILIAVYLYAVNARLEFVRTAHKLPSPSANQFALYNGRGTIYLIGGYNGVEYQGNVLTFNLDTEQVDVSGHFEAIGYGAALMHGDDIFYLGGHTNETNGRSAAIYKYSTVSDEHEVVASFPVAFVLMALMWDEEDGLAYAVGGYSALKPPELNQVYQFNVSDYSVRQTSTLSAPRFAAAGAWDTEREVGYVFGGRTSSIYDILQCARDGTIVNLRTKLPTPVEFACSVYADRDQHFYIIGGQERNTSTLFRFNPATEQVQELRVHNWSSTLSYYACTYVSNLNRIYVFGGSEHGATWEGGVKPYSDEILYLDLTDVEDELVGLPSTTQNYYYYLLLILILPGVLFVTAFACYKRRRKLNGVYDQDGSSVGDECVLTALEIAEFRSGVPNPHYQFIGTPYVCLENIHYQPYDHAYELDEEAVYINQSMILGYGEFGIVLRGVELKTRRPVAVKTVKPGSKNRMHLKALLGELKVLIYLGQHVHIVNLIGAHTKKLNKGRMHLVVEFCPLGDLEKYLRKWKENVVQECELCSEQKLDSPKQPRGVQHYLQPGDLHPASSSTSVTIICICDLLRWSMQTASAMEYLSGKKVIHGDLATRNILLASKSCAKITDFGLARKLYNYASYTKTYETPLPWRSLAIESLVEGTFSTKSDVWSFGVTLRELFSLGGVPYSTGMHFSMNFIVQLTNGVRLQKPQHCPDAVYEDIMLPCWRLNTNDRPTFAELHAKLERITQNYLSSEMHYF